MTNNPVENESKKYKPLTLHMPKREETVEIVAPIGGLTYSGKELFDVLDQFKHKPNPPTVWLCGLQAFDRIEFMVKRALWGEATAMSRQHIQRFKYQGMIVRLYYNSEASNPHEVRMISEMTFERAILMKRKLADDGITL